MEHRCCNPELVELIYTDRAGNTHAQSVSDLVRSGTLIDPGTDDDMPVTVVRVEIAPPADAVLGAVNAPVGSRYRVRWEIDDTGDAASPQQAAARAWHDVFGRDTASYDDACLFDVLDRLRNRRTVVDLSDIDAEELRELMGLPMSDEHIDATSPPCRTPSSSTTSLTASAPFPARSEMTGTVSRIDSHDDPRRRTACPKTQTVRSGTAQNSATEAH